MNKNQTNGHSNVKTAADGDFELMGDTPKQDPLIAELRRLREHEITKKLGEYLLKGYCMLSETCSNCDCILLRTPDRQLLCVGCNEIDANNKKISNEGNATATKKNGQKKRKNRKERGNNMCSYNQLENKLKWAVDELTKSENPDRIQEMCSVIIKLTETIKVLKEHEITSAQN